MAPCIEYPIFYLSYPLCLVELGLNINTWPSSLGNYRSIVQLSAAKCDQGYVNNVALYAYLLIICQLAKEINFPSNIILPTQLPWSGYAQSSMARVTNCR